MRALVRLVGRKSRVQPTLLPAHERREVSKHHDPPREAGRSLTTRAPCSWA